MLAPTLACLAQSFSTNEEKYIRKVLSEQQDAWNKGDIAAFMTGYWKSDSLTFTGANGITYGWENTYQNYLKRYDSPAKMGQLTFTILEVLPLGNDYCKVIGKWFLKRTVGDIGGHFTLVFRRFGNGWKIISDHTS
jgi:ketosteroid isomerase-like protein